jgi:hypothetical protein
VTLFAWRPNNFFSPFYLATRRWANKQWSKLKVWHFVENVGDYNVFFLLLKMFSVGKLEGTDDTYIWLGTGSRNRILIYGQNEQFYSDKQVPFLVLYFKNAPLIKCRHFHFLHIGELKLIGDISDELLNFFVVLVAPIGSLCKLLF